MLLFGNSALNGVTFATEATARAAEYSRLVIFVVILFIWAQFDAGIPDFDVSSGATSIVVGWTGWSGFVGPALAVGLVGA